MRHFDLIVSAVWLLVGAAICATSFSHGIIGPSGPESGFFPLLAGLAIAGGSGVQLALPRQRGTDFDPFVPEDGSVRRVVLVLAIMVGMVAGLPWLGFNLSGIAGMILLVRAVGRPGWIFTLVFSILSTLISFYVFNTVLGMSLPRGPFGL